MTAQAEVQSSARPRGLAPRLGALLAPLADLLLPPVCISCRARVERHGLLCGACWSEIDFIARPYCQRLGVPLPYDAGEPSLSASAIANPPLYDRARAVASYGGKMRELIQSFKYGDRHEGVALFGRWLAQAGEEILRDSDLILPVPLHRSKLWSRRFNQSAMLALEAGRLVNKPVDCLLLARVKRTGSQVGLSATERKKNVAGAFRVVGQRVALRGKRIVLIDDVVTTGATAEACARMLKRAGATSVDVLSLARAIEASALA